MSKIGLMTLTEFKAATKVAFALRRNPLITDLDHLVELYHKPSLTTQQELKVLAHIVIWCLEYLKSDGTRKTGVDQLLQQALILIDSPLYEYALDDRNSGKRDADPSKGQAKRQIVGKSLEPAYKAETVLPGKGRVAGLKLKAPVKRYNVPAYRDPALDLLTGGSDEGYEARHKYMAMIGADDLEVATFGDRSAERLIAQMPLSGQLKLLSKAMSFDAEAANDRRRDNFEYCSKEERLKYRLYIDGGRFYHDIKLRRPVDTGKRQAIYAIDEMGNVFMKFEEEMGHGSFNHSSFMSGKPVMCAGNISFANGYLTMIDNGSGHYRPGARNLKDAISFLHYQRGVSMQEVVVRRCELPKVNGKYQQEPAWSLFWKVA